MTHRREKWKVTSDARQVSDETEHLASGTRLAPSHGHIYIYLLWLRMPAWCDRILWRAGETSTSELEDLELFEYNHCLELNTSDHKPVYALMSLQVRDKIFHTFLNKLK